MRAVRRHAGRKPGAEPLGLAGAVGGLPEQTATREPARRRSDDCPSVVHTGAKSAAGPNVSWLSVWRARSHTQMSFSWSRWPPPRASRPATRADGRRGAGAHRAAPPGPADPPTPACAPPATSGASTYARVPSAATSKFGRSLRLRHQPRQHRHRRPTRLQPVEVERDGAQRASGRVDQVPARDVVRVAAARHHHPGRAGREVEHGHLCGIGPARAAVMVKSTARPPGSISGQR